MPYIIPERRTTLNRYLADLAVEMFSPGDMAYCYAYLARKYVKRFGKSYRTLSQVVGVMDTTKWEFNEKVVKPYEQAKEAENGPVYVF